MHRHTSMLGPAAGPIAYAMLIFKSPWAEHRWQAWYNCQTLGWVRLASVISLLHIPMAVNMIWRSQLKGEKAWLAGKLLFLLYFSVERVCLSSSLGACSSRYRCLLEFP